LVALDVTRSVFEGPAALTIATSGLVCLIVDGRIGDSGKARFARVSGEYSLAMTTLNRDFNGPHSVNRLQSEKAPEFQ
jgi:hypothetical protein